MNILVIDGQGGRIGSLLIENIKKEVPDNKITAVGTNSIATSAMLKAGADMGATGENPVRVLAPDAQIIVGPIGIITAHSLLGEITCDMASCIGKSKAFKVLIPMEKCGVHVCGTKDLPLSEYIKEAVSIIKANCSELN